MRNNFEALKSEMRELIATAVPVRVFSIEYAATMERFIVKAAQKPFRNINCFGVCLTNSELNKDRCPAPIAGKKENNGAIIDAIIVGLTIFLLDKIAFVDCSTVFGESDKPDNKDEIPNNPDRRGRRGSFTGRLKAKNPSKPERKKIQRQASKFFPRRIR